MTGKKRKEGEQKADQIKAEKAREEEELIVEDNGLVNGEPEAAESMEVAEEATEMNGTLQWQQEKEELLDRIKRKQADIDNLRRISKIEQAEAREYALYEFLCRLLPVMDNIERGLEAARADKEIPPAYIEGLEMIHRQLMQILEQENVTVIETERVPFDPHCHHAVMQVEDQESEPGTVLEELQKGYRHRRRILRPAMVKVCRE
jgi:molecular chaperone GrpE